MNGKNSEWAPILSGVQKGSILEPLLLLIFINEAGIISQIKLFADDTSLYSEVHDPEQSIRELNYNLVDENNWVNILHYNWVDFFRTTQFVK